MSYYKVTHSEGLFGEVEIQGSKNSVLPIIAATILNSGQTIIKNCPRISDVDNMIKILSALGANCRFEKNILVVDTSQINKNMITDNAVSRIRSSVIFMGALAGRFGSARITYPGGCNIGERKIDAHLDAFSQLGFGVTENENIYVEGRITEDKNVNLKVKSVGATENAIISSVLSDGRKIVINNAVKEPEIVSLCEALNKMGADIKGAGTSRIEIVGVRKLHDSEIEICPDRIVAGTYIAALCGVGGSITIKNIGSDYDKAILENFYKLGVNYKFYGNELDLKCAKIRRPLEEITVSTAVYPGFPTDMQSQLMAVMTTRAVKGIIVENIFENRFTNVLMLKKMGASIAVVSDKIAFISGVTSLKGCSVEAPDLRSGAALCIAGLMAEGVTKIYNPHYILRGYEHIDEDFRKLSAKVEYMEE